MSSAPTKTAAQQRKVSTVEAVRMPLGVAAGSDRSSLLASQTQAASAAYHTLVEAAS